MPYRSDHQNPCDPHGHPNAYLAANSSMRVRRSTSIEGSHSHWAQLASREHRSRWVLRVRADPPNRGLMTLIWSNWPPLQVRVRGEIPQSGAHTISPGLISSSTPVFWRREQIPPIRVSWLSYGPIDPLYEWGWEERPPNWGLIPSHKAQSAPWLSCRCYGYAIFPIFSFSLFSPKLDGI